jgi:hypothetical protein
MGIARDAYEDRPRPTYRDQQGDRLFFYDEDTEPKINLQFPSESSASDTFAFSLTPPSQGFMQLCPFLHFVAAFETFYTFFPAPIATLPDQFSAGSTPAFRRKHMSFSFMSAHCRRWRLALPTRTSTFSWMRSGIGCFPSSARLSN